MTSVDAGGEKSGKRALLLAVDAVSYPLPGRRDPFAGGHHGGVAHRGDQVAVTARLAPQHAEAISGVVIGDVLDQADQDFLVRTLGTCAGLCFMTVWAQEMSADRCRIRSAAFALSARESERVARFLARSFCSAAIV